jgi:hypothetical protein
MAAPFTISGSLVFAPDSGQPQATQPFSTASTFESKTEQELNISGAGSQVISFGTLGSPGAKALLIEVDASSTGAPINVNVNGGTDDLEISPGGFLALGSPAPVTGITSITIVSTTANKVRIRVLG